MAQIKNRKKVAMCDRIITIEISKEEYNKFEDNLDYAKKIVSGSYKAHPELFPISMADHYKSNGHARVSKKTGMRLRKIRTGGQKIYLATTVAKGCFLGVEPSQTCDEQGLTKAYGVFKKEAGALNPGYEPNSVNLDGWHANNLAWKSCCTLLNRLRNMTWKWFTAKICPTGCSSPMKACQQFHILSFHHPGLPAMHPASASVPTRQMILFGLQV